MPTILCPILVLLAGCAVAPTGLPTEDAVRAIEQQDLSSTPPLYQYLYDSAWQPEVQRAEQRARLLLWLRVAGLREGQLRELLSLHERAALLRERLAQSQARIAERYDPTLAPAYDQVFALLAGGTPLDDARFAQIAATLAAGQAERQRVDELMALRMQSIRTLLDEEQTLLSSLRPEQEARFPELVFALRHQLDMASNAGDFKVLVGSTYSVGDPTLILRGDWDPERTPLGIGGLWSNGQKSDPGGPVLHQARRELLLYLLLQEPALPEAIAGALQALGVGEPATADPVEPPAGEPPPT